VVPWLAAALFLGFGVKLLSDAQRMRADEAEDEEQEAEQAINAAESRRRISTTIFLATAPAFTCAGLLAGTLLGQALVTWVAVGPAQRRPVPGVRPVCAQAGPRLTEVC